MYTRLHSKLMPDASTPDVQWNQLRLPAVKLTTTGACFDILIMQQWICHQWITPAKAARDDIAVQ